jgi:hypothetical protein
LGFKVFDGPDHQDDRADHIVRLPNGNFAVGGFVSGSSRFKVAVVCYTPTGQRIWTRYLSGTDPSGFDTCVELLAGADSSVYVGADLDQVNFTDPNLFFFRLKSNNGSIISQGSLTSENSNHLFNSVFLLNSVDNPIMIGQIGTSLVVGVANKNTGTVFLNRVIEDIAIRETAVIDSSNTLLIAGTVFRSPNVGIRTAQMSSTGVVTFGDTFLPPQDSSIDLSGVISALGIQGDFWVGGIMTEPFQGENALVMKFHKNLPPVGAADTFAATEDTNLVVNAANGVLANDTDPNNDTLTAVLFNAPPATKGTLTLNADGSFTFVPKLNVNGPVTFSYRAKDNGNLASAITTVTINIAPVNDPPVAVSEAFSVQKGQTLTLGAPGVLSNDTDVDGDPLTAQLIAGSQVGAGTLTLNANGSFSFVAPATAGTTTFLYKAKDPSNALSGQRRVTINITN